LENVGRCTPLSLFSLSAAPRRSINVARLRPKFQLAREPSFVLSQASAPSWPITNTSTHRARRSSSYITHGVAASVPAVETLLPQGLTDSRIRKFPTRPQPEQRSSRKAPAVIPTRPSWIPAPARPRVVALHSHSASQTPSTTVLARCIAPPRAQDSLCYLPG
jgi:hypothetical protein